jgi:hypothetical protein
VNGTASKGGTPSGLVPPQIGQRREAAIAARRAQRASTLELLEKGTLEEPSSTAPTAPTEVEAAPVAEAEEPAGIPDDGGNAEPEVPAAKAAPATPASPAVNDALAKIQSAEKKSRETLKAERAAFEKERAEFAREQAEAKELREKASKFDALKKAAPADPVAAFRELGVDFEYGAKQAWQHHLATKDPANPQHRDAAARLQRDQSQETELAAVKRELAEIKSNLDKRDQSQRAQAEAGEYFNGMAQSIAQSTDTPLLRSAITKNPKGTWKRLADITLELEKEHGERPDAADVLATYEKRRLEELDELGIAPPTAAATTTDSTTTKKNHTPADKKQPAKTLGTDLSTPRVVQPRPDTSTKEHRAKTLEMLEAGKLE